jgi:Family of unknown function (DUF6527)
MLNLLDQHSLEIEGGLPTVSPSILAADAACLSHFWLNKGQAVYAEQWSQAKVKRVMSAQLLRHLKAEKYRKPVGWHRRAFEWLSSAMRR